jgi:hypothetical protein
VVSGWGGPSRTNGGMGRLSMAYRCLFVTCRCHQELTPQHVSNTVNSLAHLHSRGVFEAPEALLQPLCDSVRGGVGSEIMLWYM